jgi:TIR domain
MAHDVFISYSTKNKSVADPLWAALESAAIRCWSAPRDVQPGLPFAGQITRAIHGSKAMVLIFSADSNNSEQILRELELAANAHLPIVQFRIEDLTPNDDLRYYLSTPHWFDATTVPLEKHLGPFAIAIKALLESSEKQMKKGVREITRFVKHKLTASLDGYEPKEKDLVVDQGTEAALYEEDIKYPTDRDFMPGMQIC